MIEVDGLRIDFFRLQSKLGIHGDERCLPIEQGEARAVRDAKPIELPAATGVGARDVLLDERQDTVVEKPICIDRFHVVKRVTKAVGDVRRGLQGADGATKAQTQLLRSCREPMLMRRADLEALDDAYAAELAEKRARFESTPVRGGDLNDLPGMRAREPLCRKPGRALAPGDGLRLAYDLLQDFYAWPGAPRTAKKRDGLRRWVALAKSSGVPETGAAADALWERREGILNGYRHNRTNAQAEGTNNAIKVIKRMGCGFRGFSRVRRRLMLALGHHRIVEGHGRSATWPRPPRARPTRAEPGAARGA